MRRIHVPGLLESPSGIGQVRFEAEPSRAISEAARDLLAYCAARKRGQYLLRSDFRPADVVRLLPNLFIAEPIGGDDLRFRLVGTGIVDRLGMEPTGMTVRQIFEPGSAAQIVKDYRLLCQIPEPIVMLGRHFGLDRDFGTEVVNLPILARDGRTIHLFGAVFFPA